MRGMTIDENARLLEAPQYAGALAEFHALHYLRINQRRQEHLESLQLNLRGRKVWEVSAGVGDHTSYFLDRACSVTCSEARPELLQILRLRYPEVQVIELNLEEPDENFPKGFEVVYAYGVLYHLRNPQQCLEFFRERTSGLLLLETCVSLGTEESINLVDEPAELFSQAVGGTGCRPTRTWIFNRLKALFPFVYVPVTQPNHEQFPVEWSSPDQAGGYYRAIFVASVQAISNPLLLEHVPDRQRRH
jgi:hypothetical protein